MVFLIGLLSIISLMAYNFSDIVVAYANKDIDMTSIRDKLYLRGIRT